MASSSRKKYLLSSRKSHPDAESQSLSMDNSDSALELEEFEIYNSGRRSAKKKASSWSVPVNIPDWSKILGDEYLRRNKMMEKEEDYDVERVPPHEFLAKTRVASFSVHEGVGRTLKGRDLSTVRNTIWAKTGFQD